MSGDLEDFLRRAAQRRAETQQGAGGQTSSGSTRQPQSKPQPKPQYTDARRERQVRPPVEDEIPVAEIIETVNPLTEKQQQIAKSKQRAEAARAEIALQQEAAYGNSEREMGTITIEDGTPAEQLLALIRRPTGLQQAFLLREILERPEDRW